MKTSVLATLAGLLGYSIFGFSFLFSKIALGLTTPFVLLSVRFLTAFLVMNVLVLTGRMKLSLRGKPVKMLLLLGLVQPVVYFICENYGIALTSASFSGIMLGIIYYKSGSIVLPTVLHILNNSVATFLTVTFGQDASFTEWADSVVLSVLAGLLAAVVSIVLFVRYWRSHN